MEKQSKKEKIAAVVVTYNRKELMKECLDALLRQTYPVESIILIDNASNDGTPEFLRGNGYLDNPKIDYAIMPKNIGGAGGFYEGVRRGYEKGFDWLWLMDDDAVPDHNALGLLIVASKCSDDRVFNSLVLTPDRESICFGYNYYKYDTYRDGVCMVQTVTELKSLNKTISNGLAQFFNGSLIHRTVIDVVGLPQKEYFTRGDEVDYVLHIQNSGFKTYTVLGSIITHPQEPYKKVKLLGYKFTLPVSSPWKQYYMLRNEIINSRKYNFLSEFLPYLYLKLLLNYTIRSIYLPNNKILRQFYTLWGFIDGIFGNLYSNKFINRFIK